MEAAEKGAERLWRVIGRDDQTGGKGEALDAEPYRQQFIEAMDDDFNTAQALASLFDLARAINQAGDSELNVGKARVTLKELGGVLGLTFEEPPIIYAAQISIGISRVIQDAVKARVNRLIEERANCRREKNWQQADEIRKKLAEIEVTLEDTKAGTKATFKRPPSEESLDNLMKELGIDFQDTPEKDG